MQLKTMPEPWVLGLTKDETDLYHNLTPNYRTGFFDSEFQVRVEIEPDNLTIDQLVAELLAAKRKGCTEIWTQFNEIGSELLVLTGSVPLTDDEKEVFDSLMVKVRKFRKEQVEESLAEAKQKAERLQKELDEYVW